MMSGLQDDLNDSYVCYRDLFEYVGLSNIEQGFYVEPALKIPHTGDTDSLNVCG